MSFTLIIPKVKIQKAHFSYVHVYCAYIIHRQWIICLLFNRLLIEDWEIYFLLDVDDGTTFMNQDEYISCLERMRKYKTLMLSTNNYTISALNT